MTQEDKNLLFKDLCGRLPYGVKGKYQYSKDESLRKIPIDDFITEVNSYEVI